MNSLSTMGALLMKQQPFCEKFFLHSFTWLNSRLNIIQNLAFLRPDKSLCTHDSSWISPNLAMVRAVPQTSIAQDYVNSENYGRLASTDEFSCISPNLAMVRAVPQTSIAQDYVNSDNYGRLASNGKPLGSDEAVRNLCQNGKLQEALQTLDLMYLQGLPIQKGIMQCLLEKCSKTQDLAFVRQLCSFMATVGADSNAFLGGHLIRLFASCGSLVEANNVFCNVAKPSLYTWNAIISAHVKLGDGRRALDLFNAMKQMGLRPNKGTFSCIVKACSTLGAIEQGRLIHEEIIKSGLESNVVIANTLIHMYSKCGTLQEAHKVFDEMPDRSAVSWAVMISAYAQHGHGHSALQLFEKMCQEGVRPDKVTYLCALKACSSIGAIEQGRIIHDMIIECGLDSDMVVGSAIVDMYAKCGRLEMAHKVFDGLLNRDVVSWGAIITGYAQHEYVLPALQLYKRMQEEGLNANRAIFLGILKACGSTGAIGQGRLIHDQIIRCGLDSEIAVGNTLVDMYAKCGSLEEARRVFDVLPDRDVVSWAAIIAGYAQYGDCNMVRQCLEDMQQQGLKPNNVIFLNTLSAYCHSGLLDEGSYCFKSMTKDHGVVPEIAHYNCMIDLLGRVGCFNEAEKLLQDMPFRPDSIGLTALLTGCRTYGNVDVGRRCFDQIIQLDPTESSAYVLMSNIYADANMEDNANRIQELRKHAGAWKKPGKAWIEASNEVHEFIVGDKSHPKSDQIYKRLKALSQFMKEEGYVPNLDLVLDPMSEEEKEDALCGHCERLAIAFGLVSTEAGTTIRVTKNIRVCTDCHTASKIISKIEKREIIIRDAYRIHHLKDGVCSCGDYF